MHKCVCTNADHDLPRGQFNIALGENFISGRCDMKKFSTRILTVTLSIAMLLSSFCIGVLPAVAAGEITPIDESVIIENADSLANGVQAYFADENREQFIVKNQQMNLTYELNAEGNKQVASLTTKDGTKTYIENTMDAFVTIDGKDRIYASNSSSVATANLHRFGYYYYDARFEGQDFLAGSPTTKEDGETHDVKNFWVQNSLDVTVTSGGSKSSPGSVSGTITNTGDLNTLDPYIVFGESDPSWMDSLRGYKYESIAYPAGTYNYISITMAVSEGITGATFFYEVSGATGFTQYKSVSFSVIGDGQSREYMVPMFNGSDYSGTIGRLRLDFSGGIDETFTVSELAVVQVDMGDSIEGLQVARSFLVYTDKMHSFTQFATTKTVEKITEFGVEVKIPKNDVSEYVFEKDEYAGFCITGVGVFGYIMPCDGSGGELTVTEKTIDGTDYYVITQINKPAGGTLIPSYEGMEIPNGNDFYIGQRIYTDTNDTLTDFIAEAEIEREPLTSENIEVSEDCDGSFVGYDAIRGIYKFNIDGFHGFSEPALSAINKKFHVNFTVTGDEKDRKIWVMTATTGGCLESAVLLDANEMLIPVPVQVGKNFSEENPRLFNIDDTSYGESIFPMEVKANSSAEYTVVNAYQNWGKYPLKQISWIQFSTPYYHLSTGVTESTCITPMYSTKAANRTYSTLPDFRPMSAPFWSDQPQHPTCGDHKWLMYTDSEGNFNGSENYNNVITSHGPTYAEIEMQNISDDGNIRVTYTHMEMPQTDENRTYYQIKYEILGDVSFTDFSRDFQFYSVESMDPTGLYQRVGYLGTDNKCYVATAKAKGTSEQYTLGSYYPYFSFFDMDGATSDHNRGGYANLGLIVCGSDISIKDATETPRFVLNDLGGKLSLSLNLEAVTLKAGDSITINAILLPWGSQEMEGTYDDIQDKNVRDVRADMALRPVTITPVENAEVVESVYLPRVKTTNGTEAIFTVSGDESNQTIRVDGFTMLTDPKIQEWSEMESKWVDYVVCSATTPDVNGDGHSYDGYNVYYNSEDGTYSYSFVITLNGDQARKFKVVADTAFDGWELSVDSNVSLQNMNVLFAGDDLRARNIMVNSNAVASDAQTDESGVTFVRFAPKATGQKEFYTNLYAATDPVNTGKYVVIKYRLPSTTDQTVQDSAYIEMYTSTENANATSSDSYVIDNHKVFFDDAWHLAIFDAASFPSKTFKPEADGTCLTRYMRIDFLNGVEIPTGTYMDVAYVGMTDSISEIFAYDTNFKDAWMLYSTADITAGTRLYSQITAPEENEIVNISVASPVINPDDLFIIPVNIQNNTGISYLDIMPVYDNTKFTFMGYVNGDMLEGLSVNGSHIIWSNTYDSSEDGTLINLAFKANFDLEEDSQYDFSVKVVDANSISGQGVNTAVTAGTVTFRSYAYGKVVDDGSTKITTKDVVTLREYIANFNYETGESTVKVSAGADVNCDGSINTLDLILLRQYLANYNYDTGESTVVLGPQITDSTD